MVNRKRNGRFVFKNIWIFHFVLCYTLKTQALVADYQSIGSLEERKEKGKLTREIERERKREKRKEREREIRVYIKFLIVSRNWNDLSNSLEI